jgi:poly-gamma-glutamate synthesis protein (capsule biosynthesis protein)
VRATARLHIGLAALFSCIAVVAGCTPSHPAPRVHTSGSSTSAQPSRTTASSPAPIVSGTPAVRPPRHHSRYTIAFAGDVNFAGRLASRLAHNPRTVFGAAAQQLRPADLTMVNLETAITTGGVQQNKEFTFRAPPAALAALRDAGIDVATMANNHGADYGTSGLHDTLRAIRSEHFPVIGIGKNAHAAFAPYRTTLDGTKVAIIAADQVQDETTLSLYSAGPHKIGVANAYQSRLVSAVHAARRAGYVVIVYVHWGIELQTCPSSDQTGLAHRLAAAGASAVIGTHAHVLQGAGWLPNGTYVAYGLGNYLWWLSFGNIQDDNGVLTLSFHHGSVTKAHFAPSRLDERGVPMPASGADRQRILAEWRNDRSCTDLSSQPPK